MSTKRKTQTELKVTADRGQPRRGIFVKLTAAGDINVKYQNLHSLYLMCEMDNLKTTFPLFIPISLVQVHQVIAPRRATLALDAEGMSRYLVCSHICSMALHPWSYGFTVILSAGNGTRMEAVGGHWFFNCRLTLRVLVERRDRDVHVEIQRRDHGKGRSCGSFLRS